MGKNNLWDTPRVDAYCYEYGKKKKEKKKTLSKLSGNLWTRSKVDSVNEETLQQ